MRITTALAAFLLASCGSSAKEPPLPSGRYTFQHRFSEQPSIPSVALTAVVDGAHIVLTNQSDSPALPKGVVAEGMLLWHPASGQWIIGNSPADAAAKEVGGCSDGPEVVDLANHIYWTC